MTDREDAGLRGCVKTCSTERQYMYPDHEWVMRTHEIFSAGGHLLERRHQNADGSRWSVFCHYGEHGRILAKEESGSGAGGSVRSSYLYDRQGRLDRVMVSSPANGERVSESVQYAADATSTRTLYVEPVDAAGVRTGVSAEDMLHVSLDAAVIMTMYDAEDRRVRKVLYDADDRVIRRIGFRHDSRGLLLEEGELIQGAVQDNFRNTYQYDEHGRPIVIERRWVRGWTRRTFTYNDRNDVVQEAIEQDVEFWGDQITFRGWAQRYAYLYDQSDNWIERTTETIDSTGECCFSMIERRQFSLY